MQIIYVGLLNALFNMCYGTGKPLNKIVGAGDEGGAEREEVVMHFQ